MTYFRHIRITPLKWGTNCWTFYPFLLKKKYSKWWVFFFFCEVHVSYSSVLTQTIFCTTCLLQAEYRMMDLFRQSRRERCHLRSGGIYWYECTLPQPLWFSRSVADLDAIETLRSPKERITKEAAIFFEVMPFLASNYFSIWPWGDWTADHDTLGALGPELPIWTGWWSARSWGNPSVSVLRSFLLGHLESLRHLLKFAAQRV